jgi:hypothetical protein
VSTRRNFGATRSLICPTIRTDVREHARRRDRSKARPIDAARAELANERGRNDGEVGSAEIIPRITDQQNRRRSNLPALSS